jgi:hypothetical protein
MNRIILGLGIIIATQCGCSRESRSVILHVEINEGIYQILCDDENEIVSMVGLNVGSEALIKTIVTTDDTEYAYMYGLKLPSDILRLDGRKVTLKPTDELKYIIVHKK